MGQCCGCCCETLEQRVKETFPEESKIINKEGKSAVSKVPWMLSGKRERSFCFDVGGGLVQFNVFR